MRIGIRSLVVLAIVVDAGCTSAATSTALPQVALDSAFELGVGQTVRLDESNTTLRMIAVTEDSRCPATAQCIWAGNGRVQLEIITDTRSDTGSVNTTLDPRALMAGSFTVRLVALNPEPGTEKIPAEKYRATLVVSGK